MRWESLGRIERGGQQLYRCLESGRYSLGDDSGEFPDLCDDGVLWLRPTCGDIVEIHEEEIGRWFVPVTVANDGREAVVIVRDRGASVIAEIAGAFLVRSGLTW